MMLRDIDYAATAVRTAIIEKFGRRNSLDQLQVVPNEKSITVHDGQHIVEAPRDSLMGALRKADTYDDFWQIVDQVRAATTR
jgi:hypothetical protein